MLLAICGGPLLQLWMGERYANGWLVGILAAGHTGAILQLPVMAILAGMNRHGRLAIANMVGSSIAAVGVVCVLGWLKLGLVWVAFAGTWPLVVVNFIYAPVHICRRAGLAVNKYVKEAFLFPLVCTSPFMICLVAARLLFSSRPAMALLVGGAIGVLLLVPIYWRHVIPPSLKRTLLQKMRPTLPNLVRANTTRVSPANTDA
jgi:hypothetical protein